MLACDVVIVGGGPAGSTCAWRLRRAGLDVVVLDKSRFPRDKVCAGWITPQVVEEVELDLDDYRRSRTCQEITGFRVSVLGRPATTIDFGKTVSYGIRRCEFDHYLLQRCGAELRLGEPAASIEQVDGRWVVNGEVRAKVLVGAGGHFCPVARKLRDAAGEEAPVVAAQEIEFAPGSFDRWPAASGTHPELYFFDDLAGYGWCVRKGEVLNIGLGRVGAGDAAAQRSGFLEKLRRIHPDGETPPRLRGHAYRLYDGPPRTLSGDNVLLIGDAAGLAYPQSGEGIRPAIESGLLAAEAILRAGREGSAHPWQAYEQGIAARFGARRSAQWTAAMPRILRAWLARRLISSRWLTRRLVLDNWFLHRKEPALATGLRE